MAAPTPSPIIRIRLRNSTARDTDLWIEPVGDHVAVPKRTAIEVQCTEQLGHPVEVEVSDNAMSIHGWVVAVSALGDDGSLRQLWALPDA